MNRKTLIFVIIILTLVLAGELVFVGYMEFNREQIPSLNDPTVSQTEDTTPTDAPETEATTLPTEAPVEETEETLPTETEPEQNRYLLTFVGDCTLGNSVQHQYTSGGFNNVVGEDYNYNFQNVGEYFANDDFTMINLEGVLGEEGWPAGKAFEFRGPSGYINILTGGSVEALTLANNHARDYGQRGYDRTVALLEEAGIGYVEKDKTAMFTTERGLTIGVFGACFTYPENMAEIVTGLREEGAEIVIYAIHWGAEGSYEPRSHQVQQAYDAIDAGVDIVYGHHPHVLQKIEEYNGGIIYYSMGNFCFGGNQSPPDYDTVILQQQVISHPDGAVELGELTVIPASISSSDEINNYQPTPYEPGSEEYERTMGKLFRD